MAFLIVFLSPSIGIQGAGLAISGSAFVQNGIVGGCGERD
jgi:hypothetical protein